MLRQPEVDAANQNAWSWYRSAQELEQRVRFLDNLLREKDGALRAKDDLLMDKSMLIAQLRVELGLAKLAAAPGLPPPGSSTHHPNGHDLG